MGKYRTRAMPKEREHLTHWIYAVFPHIERSMRAYVFSHTIITATVRYGLIIPLIVQK